MKKRILWITERFPPLGGGMSTSAQRQVSLLRANGYEVDVLIFLQKDIAEIKLEVKNRDCGNDIYILYNESIANAIQKGWQTVREFSINQQYSLIVGFGCNQPGLIATTYAKWQGIPSLVSVRGNDFDRDWFDPRRHAVVSDALSMADNICCVTQEKVEKIKALYPNKNICWLPNGIDIGSYEIFAAEKNSAEEIRKELNADTKWIIGIFGEIKYKKRIPFFLEVLRTNNLFDKVSLLLVGKMDYHVDAIFNDPALVPQFKHISFRLLDEMPVYYHACDFVAIPSMFEGFPNVLLEAMACGRVPLVSDSGAMPDVINHGENGFIFRAENFADATDSITAALETDKTAFQKISEKAKSCVIERFSLEKETLNLKEIIESFVG
ncbi:MAG: glycosyltransferase family 1 protein [Gammaproteobacteria bacterium]|nr:MAG: glycosyltransferase family 1 protein [Gammaproteobacteria bacterium]